MENSGNFIYEKEGGYEKNNIFNSIVSKSILIPAFKYLPKAGKRILLKSSSDARIVYDNIKTSRALEVLYNYGKQGKTIKNLKEKVFTFFWHHFLSNAKGVRNRYKLARREIIKSFAELGLNSQQIKLFSIASGSARTVIDAIKYFKNKNTVVEARLLDLSKDALSLSEEIAKENGVIDKITFYNDKASNFSNYCDEWKPNIIEMVGFMDYLNKDKAIKLVTNIYNNLQLGGYFITANILKNSEDIFMSNILDWDMVYRTKEDILDVLIDSGFKKENCLIYIEPTLIHGVAVCKK